MVYSTGESRTREDDDGADPCLSFRARIRLGRGCAGHLETPPRKDPRGTYVVKNSLGRFRNFPLLIISLLWRAKSWNVPLHRDLSSAADRNCLCEVFVEPALLRRKGRRKIKYAKGSLFGIVFRKDYHFQPFSNRFMWQQWPETRLRLADSTGDEKRKE